jgi:perosamine synthetase
MSPVAASASLANQVVHALRDAIGDAPASLHEPLFAGKEWDYLKECLDSTYVSSVGAFVDRFERELASYTGARNAVAVVNGTAALHVALQLAGVERGDEVLIPTLSFVATANAVAYCGAIPHLVDSEERTLGMDAAALRAHLQEVADLRDGACVNRVTGRRIRAVVPMHTFGHPVDIAGLLSVADDLGLVLVEDAAESLGSTFGERHAGTFGLMGTLSFNGNKTITTGGGGAILTDDADLAKRAKHLTTTAKVPHPWAFIHDAVGYNYRLPNINAALGCAQLEQLRGFVEAKRRLFERYRSAFAAVPQVRIVEEPEGCRSNYWLQTLVLDESVEDQRDEILKATNDAGFMTRPSWTPMHRLAPYETSPRADLEVAESLERRMINLPSSAFLSGRIVDR